MSLLTTLTGTVTPDATTVWLKNVARPYLNRTVTVIGFSGVGRRGRGAVLDVLGRRLPVAITEVAGSREFSLVLRAADAEEAAALDLVLTFGDTIYLQVPAGCVVPASGHFLVTQVDSTPAPGMHDTEVRYVTLTLVEVDAPDDSIVGSTITYAGVAAAWATYLALLGDPAVPTYADLADYVSAPADEVVG